MVGCTNHKYLLLKRRVEKLDVRKKDTQSFSLSLYPISVIFERMRAQKAHMNVRLHISQDFGAEVTGRAGIVTHAMQTWHFDLLNVMKIFLWSWVFADDALWGIATRLDSSCWQRMVNFRFHRKASMRFFAISCCRSGFNINYCFAEFSTWCVDLSAFGNGLSSPNSCRDNVLGFSIESRGGADEKVGLATIWKAQAEQYPHFEEV